MKNVILILSIFILSILLVGTAYILKNEDLCCKIKLCKQLTTVCDGKNDKDTGEVLSEKGEKLQLENIKDGDTVDLGFEIKGSVSGEWFFEGIFPVRIFNQYGEIIDTISATAIGDWTTDKLVPFSAVLDTEIEEESIVVLRFEKSNPSDLEENSDYAQITITVKPVVEDVETISLKVFFGSTKLNPEVLDCSLVFPVTREVEKTVAVGRAALTELFKGTTEKEENEGYFTNINDGVEIQSLSISEGIAKVDLNSKLEEGVGGSCKVTAIRAQIEETLKQFSTVDSVVISINGNTQDILQP